ncbi:3-mercaptopyruvate sulfurtransferase-like [Arapaima gigas]
MSPNALAVVGARWLADAVKGGRLGPALRLLDASWHLPKTGRNALLEFRERHIPGASFFDIDECCDKTSPFDHMLPAEHEFAEYVSQLGIDNNTHVVVYDASDVGSYSAPRVWWMFRVFGHGAVSVLDGGLKNWLREGHPLTAELSKPEPAVFTARLNRSWVKTYEDVLNNVDSKEVQVVDARSAGRFRGVEPEPRDHIEPGHIPGSLNMPYTSFLDEFGREKTAEQLAGLFRDARVDLSKPFWATCGSGVTACHIVLAAYLCGHSGISVYDGSWAEWYTRATPEHIISEGRGKHV